jgi:redox-sensitive bicupin YhaK (pirin superfamily)
MIKTYAYEQLGHADHGWLNARHHFSFASYHNPERMAFGALRVINDDIIKAGAGFDTHPHQDMEIITYVRNGAITHRDSHGNEGRTVAGDVQVMSAGTGIYHSEFNLESEDTNLYQIWIEPNKSGIKPRWDAREFPTEESEDGLTLLVSGDGRAPLQIQQDATIHAGRINAGSELEHEIKHQAYLLVSKGAITLDGQTLKQGDGAEIMDEASIKLAAETDADVLIIDVPEQARH